MREIFPSSFIPSPNLSLLTAMVRVTDHVPALGVVAQALQLLRGSVTFAGQESNTFLEDLKRLALLADDLRDTEKSSIFLVFLLFIL